MSSVSGILGGRSGELVWDERRREEQLSEGRGRLGGEWNALQARRVRYERLDERREDGLHGGRSNVLDYEDKERARICLRDAG